MSKSDIQHEACTNDASHILVDWSNFCRDICAVYLKSNQTIIGGVNADGTPTFVKIDES